MKPLRKRLEEARKNGLQDYLSRKRKGLWSFVFLAQRDKLRGTAFRQIDTEGRLCIMLEN